MPTTLEQVTKDAMDLAPLQSKHILLSSYSMPDHCHIPPSQQKPDSTACAPRNTAGENVQSYNGKLAAAGRTV